MLHLRPHLGERRHLESAAEIDLSAFVGHGIGVVHLADDGDGAPSVGKTFAIAAEEDEDLAGFTLRAPEKVIVMSANRGGKAVAEEIDRTGESIVIAVDDCDRLLLRREAFVDALHLIGVLLPAESVGVELRQAAGGVVFAGW